jgi:cytochrome c oxidase assembly protein subunit 15
MRGFAAGHPRSKPSDARSLSSGAVKISPQRYRAITMGALVALMVIVVTGAAVRLTGSGLGCEDWPRCSDERLIDVSSSHTAIEQVNRLFTGVVAVAVIAAVLGSLWRVPRRGDLTALSLGLVAGVIGQIVLGGVTVLVDLHPLAVQAHFLLSMILVANAVVLVHRAGEPDDGRRAQVVTPRAATAVGALATAASVAIVTGTVVTGAGPHAGDEEVQRFDVSISAAARIHGVTVIIALTMAVALAAWLSRHPDDRHQLQRPLSTWIFVGLLQGALGYTQYFSDVPPLLVGIHVGGATVLWAMTVRLVLGTRAVMSSVTEVQHDPAQGLVASPTA